MKVKSQKINNMLFVSESFGKKSNMLLKRHIRTFDDYEQKMKVISKKINNMHFLSETFFNKFNVLLKWQFRKFNVTFLECLPHLIVSTINRQVEFFGKRKMLPSLHYGHLHPILYVSPHS